MKNEGLPKITLDAEVLMAETEPSQTYDAVQRALARGRDRFLESVARKKAQDLNNLYGKVAGYEF